MHFPDHIEIARAILEFKIAGFQSHAIQNNQNNNQNHSID